MFDNVAVTMFRLNDYFRKFGYKSPTDIDNTPTVFARGLENIGYFDWLAQNPELHAIFNKAMTFHATTWAGGIAASYPWDKLQPGGPDGIAVIDIGGGKGQAIREIITAFPSLSGHAGLEDLGSVLAEEGSLVTPEQVKSVTYDFIKQEQPIVGAGAYYFRHCLCDWPDWTVVTILKNQVAAMKANPASKLLINDLVLPDVGANAQRTARDIIMLQCGGVERSEKQWHRILGEAGFRIEKFHNPDDLHNGVIEAVLK